MDSGLNDDKVRKLAHMVRRRFGLDFAPERWRDLRHAIAGFHAENKRFSSAGECLDYIISPQAGSHDLELFINRLTIGETYFFRDPKALDVLEREILRPGNGKGSGIGGAVRIWSMACASGEEPYTMAMICLRSGIRSEIYGTDIDSRSLAKAREGLYRKWSFRTEATAFRDMYFNSSGTSSYLLDKTVKEMVALSRFNLIEDELPASLMQMDVILCRNVLMYFSAAGVDIVLDKIWESLNPGGFLLGTPSESALITSRKRFEPVSFGSVLFFRKNKNYSPLKFSYETGGDFFGGVESISANNIESVEENCELDFESPEVESRPDIWAAGEYRNHYPIDSTVVYGADGNQDDDFLKIAAELRVQSDFAGAMDVLSSALKRDLGNDEESAVLFAMAGIMADSGRLDESSRCCEQAIELDRLAPGPHFLLGQIRMLQERSGEAVSELRNAIFLDPGFVMAHVMLGNYFMEGANCPAASRHFRIAVQELRKLDAAEIVPYSDGTTAAGLLDMIRVVQHKSV